MKRVLSVVLVAAMALSLLVGCGAKKGGNDLLGDDGKFTVGFDAEFPPYGYADENGEYTGFDLELAEAVCKMEGWEYVKQPIDWDAKDMELSSGAIDCIWNGFTIDGREKEYTWSIPYIDNSQVYVVAADSGISTPADLAGKVVGVQKDSSALAALSDESMSDLLASFADLTQYADYNTAFMDLEAGGVDCVALDVGVANYQIESREAGKYVKLDEKLASEQYGIGFFLGNETLRDTVQKDLIALYDDGTVAALAEKYGLTDCICIQNYK